MVYFATPKKKRLREDLKSELYTGCYESKLKTKIKHTQLGKTHSVLGHFKHIGLLISNNRALDKPHWLQYHHCAKLTHWAFNNEFSFAINTLPVCHFNISFPISKNIHTLFYYIIVNLAETTEYEFL